MSQNNEQSKKYTVRPKIVYFMSIFGLLLILGGSYLLISSGDNNYLSPDNLVNMFMIVSGLYFLLKCYHRVSQPLMLFKEKFVIHGNEFSYQQIDEISRSWIDKFNLNYTINPFGSAWYYIIRANGKKIAFHEKTYTNTDEFIEHLCKFSKKTLKDV
jgi:hypothetical protein